MSSVFRMAVKSLRLHTLINMLGLGVGLAICLVVYLFVRHELSYDSHFAQADRIVLVGQRNSNNSFGSRDMSSQMVATRFPALFDQVEDATRITNALTVLLASATLEENQDGVAFADTRFLRIFDFSWLHGDPSALDVPDGVVLTETLARTYFGSVTAAHGALMEYGKERVPLRVTGIIRDLPSATHFQFKALVSMSVREDASSDEFSPRDWWWRTVYRSYVLLHEPIPEASLVETFNNFAAREFADQEVKVQFHATPLRRLHLEGRASGLIADRVLRIQVAMGVALAVLLIAVINFVNLATAVSSRRVVEVGLHRTVGASRLQVARQFLGRSVSVTCAAAILAVVLVELFLPAVNAAASLQLQLQAQSFLDWFMLLPGVLLIGLTAGAYPATLFAALKPVAALRGEGSKGRSGLWVRNSLVILQFSLSIVLVVCTVVFMRQIDYLRDYDLGFDVDQTLVVRLPSDTFLDLGTRWPAMKSALQSEAGVIDAVYATSSPMIDGILAMDLRRPDSASMQQDAGQIMGISADNAYLRFYGASLLAGEFFDEDEGLQSTVNASGMQFGETVILNEAAVRRFGWTPEQAVGQYLEYGSGGSSQLQVRGVVENFVSSLRSEPRATVFLPVAANFHSQQLGVINIRIAPEQVGRTLQHVDSVWRENFPDDPIQRRFLSDRVEEQLQSDMRQLQLFRYATVLSILIACFGLYGLAVFNAERRTKEIGVRKVMGSGVWRIVFLLTNDFSKLVLIANVIAWPLAWVIMNRWLEQFAYRIDLTPMIFIGSGLIALCVAWVTVGGTAAKAASQKPVLALRYE